MIEPLAMQLFTIGLVRLHPGGPPLLGTDGLPAPTCTRNDIAEPSPVFTGLSFSKRHQTTRSCIVEDNTTFTANNALYTLIHTTTGQGGNPLPDQTSTGYTASSDHVIMSFAASDALSMRLVDVNGDGQFTSEDTGTFNNPAALRAACEVVLDHADLPPPS